MSALQGQDLVQAQLVASLQAKLPHRHVQRSLLLDPTNAPRQQLLDGVVCVVSGGGGGFANYLGREADLGTTKVHLVCFLQVPEQGSEPADVETAELTLLAELLGWVHAPGDRSLISAVDSMAALDWSQSQQIEYPYGWLRLGLDVR